MSTKTEATQATKTKTNTKPPSMFNVIYINDNETTMEFVVESLKAIFYHSDEIAKELEASGLVSGLSLFSCG